MRGQIRLGRWRPSTAAQVLAPPGGYIWAATARLARLPVTGYDRLSSGTGEMRWRLLRLIPVMTAAGPDITRSAYGRLAGEIVLIPTAFQHATWTQGEHPGTATAAWRFDDDTETAELRVGGDGHLLQVMVNRWGNPGGEPFHRCPFGVAVEAEANFGGVIIPCLVPPARLARREPAAARRPPRSARGRHPGDPAARAGTPVVPDGHPAAGAGAVAAAV
jgi:hypothetical protein